MYEMKMLALSYIVIGVVLNYLVLRFVPRILARYRIVEEGRVVEKLVKKAGVSRKKQKIAQYRVRSFRSKVFRANFMQMFLPLLVFLASVGLCYLLTYFVSMKLVALGALPLVGSCIVPPPIEMPLGTNSCSVGIVWLEFMIFLLFSPWYTREIRKILGVR